MTEDKKCAPSKIYSNGSCFTLKQLKHISKTYNKLLDDDNILSKKIKKIKINLKNDKKYLVKELTNRLENVCDNQICWLKQSFIRKTDNIDIYNNTFKPEGPQGKFEWLNTLHIDNVMKQYEKKYTDFKYFGAVPIDFDKIYSKFKINFNDLLDRNIHKLGFIFNLDESWQSGSHWVSMFSDLKKKQIYYFDSVGTKPERRIKRLMKRILIWMKSKNNNLESINTDVLFHKKKTKGYDIKFNDIQHQYKDSECGVYSIHFILKMLQNNSFSDITESKILDNDMNQFRDKLFRFSKKNPIK